HLQGIIQVAVQGRSNDQALRRYGTHKVVELTLDGFHVFENVGVVEFQVIQNQGIRAVVDKLGALVKERAVVLIRLDHKEITAAQPGRHRKVLGHTAYQVTGIKPAWSRIHSSMAVVVVLPWVPATAITQR